MFAHERLEDFWPGQKTEAFAEMRAAAKAIELRIAGQRAQLQLFNAEKGTQLRMLAVKNRAGLAHRVLSPGERVDAHAVIVPSDRRGVVSDAQPSSIQPIRQLDVFPRRGRKCRIERMLGQELAVDGDVRRVEEVEGNDLAVTNQFVSELQPVIIDVVHERRDALAVGPSGIA